MVQPLQHRWLPQPCPLPQGCSLGEEAWDAGDARSKDREAQTTHSKERGAQTTHGPSEEGHGGLSTHRCLTEPIHVQVTCSQLQCSHLTHTLCTSLLPSGVAITAEARKQLRDCFKTARDPLPCSSGGGQGAVCPPQHPAPARARAAHPQPRHSISAGLGEDTLKDNASPKPAAHQGCGSRAGGRKGSPAVGPPCPSACLTHAEPRWPQRPSLGKQERRWGKTPGRAGSERGSGGTYPIPALRHAEALGGRGCSGGVGQAGGPGVGHSNAATGAKLSSALAQPSPGFIAEPQPRAEPSLALPPRQVWPPLRASAAMEPALSHWLPRELFMLQLAPNTLVYEGKTPGTVRYLLHLPSLGGRRQAGCLHSQPRTDTEPRPSPRPRP